MCSSYKYLGVTYEIPYRNDVAYKLSETGKERFSQLCTPLQLCVEELLHYIDVSIIEGYRSPEDQQKAYDSGHSKAKPGQSPHNYYPSFAVDIYPYPTPTVLKNGKKVIDDNSKEWDKMAAIMNMVSLQKGIDLKWGGLFKNLVDKPHFEIANYKDFLVGPTIE